MSFQRPTLAEIIKRVDDDLQSRIGVTQMRRSNAKVFGRVLSGASHGLYGYVSYLANQMFVDTAESEYLDRWASIYDVKRKQATAASGSIKFTFSGEVVNIPEGTALQSDAGILYRTTSAPSSDGVASCEAEEAGTSGNQEDGDTLTLTSPIAGVMSEVTIVGMSGGADAEDDESLRSRLLSRMRETPHGGTESDYENWALEVPGVTRAWATGLEDGAGTVALRFVCDNYDDIVPTEEMMRKVQDYIDALRPVTANVTVKPVSIKSVDITIKDLYPDTAAVRAAVEAELRALLSRESEPGVRVYLSHIRAAISAATGEEDHTVVSPTEDIIPEKNQLCSLGTITWQ